MQTHLQPFYPHCPAVSLTSGAVTYTPASAAGILFARLTLDLLWNRSYRSSKITTRRAYPAVQAEMDRLQRGRKRMPK